MDLLGARLRHLRRGSAVPETEDPVEEIERYLSEDWPAIRPLLIVLDAVDGGLDVRFPANPGLGVKVLVSTRRLESLQDSGWQRVDQSFDDDGGNTVQTAAASLLVGQLNAKDSRIVMIQGDNTGTIHMGDEVSGSLG